MLLIFSGVLLLFLVFAKRNGSQLIKAGGGRLAGGVFLGGLVLLFMQNNRTFKMLSDLLVLTRH